MSWPVKILLAGILLILLVTAYALVSQHILNPQVVASLRTDPNGARARKVMLIGLPSGKSIPVNYLREEEGLVFAAADFPWWKELRGQGAPVEVLIRGEQRRGQGRAIEDEPERRAEIFERLRPTAPLIFGTLIEIRLE
ncbi:MAG: hypothetical protein AB8G23_20405 [Myxococcota bacterium]